jgi:hypothetical protein
MTRGNQRKADKRIEAVPPVEGLDRLYRSRARVRLTVFALGVAAAVAAVLDIVTGPLEEGGLRPHWQAVLFTVVYSVLASLIASTLVSWVIFEERIKERQERSAAALGLLGLSRVGVGDEIAIVLPAFPTVEGARDATIGAPPGEAPSIIQKYPSNLLKNWGEIANHAYARRDMLLAFDLNRAITKVGLKMPHFLSDYDFLQAVHDSAIRSTGGSQEQLLIRPDTGKSEQPVRISHVILVGLWSNLATMLLQMNDKVPFKLEGVGEERKVLLQPSGGSGDYSYVSPPASYPHRAGGHQSSPAYEQGLVTRFQLPTLCLSVIGGATALGTARMGDLLADPTVAADLTSGQPEEDAWIQIQCPPHGARWNPYYVPHSYHEADYLARVVDSDGLMGLFGLQVAPDDRHLGTMSAGESARLEPRWPS